MTQSIRWESNWDLALAEARVQEKHVMLDVFNPGCGACKQMESVTYPDRRTVDFINRFLIAPRVSTGSLDPVLGQFRIEYTPTIIILDGRAREHHRSVGFLPPEEFIPSLMLGIGRAWIDSGRPQKGMPMLERLVAEFPRSRSAAEAAGLRKRHV